MLFTLVPDLSVAPLKYAHVHKDHGGPIASLSARESSFLGQNFFEAFAFLDESRTGYGHKDNFLYGGAHGSGTGLSRADAIFAAISEALERWAWHSAGSNSNLRGRLRFDLDSSTTGFAAFPGLGRQGARKRAYFEAAERWALCEWWEGRLAHKRHAALADLPGVEAVELISPFSSVAIALLWRVEGEMASYGFAAAHSFAAAKAKAFIELERNLQVLAFLRDELAKNASGLPPLNRNERRLRFFAEPAGHSLFLQRLKTEGSKCPAPALVVDSAVLGPWTQYTHVWRCLFDGRHFRESDKDDYFLF